MVASIPDASWQDGTMTSNDHATLLIPGVRLAPTDLRKFPAVVLGDGLATPKEDAVP